MDLVSDCKNKLAKFRIKELKDVLGQLGLVKQGKKQDLVDRILALLSSEEESLMHDSTRNIINGKEEVANIVNIVYRKMQGSGASNSATDEQSVYDVRSVAPVDEIVDSIVDKKICCPCGSSLPTNYLVECADANCRVLQHILCVIIPEESCEGIPPAPPHFYCEVCRINRADPFCVGVREVLSPVKLVLSNNHDDGTNSPQNLNTEFEITRADQHMLVNSEYDVQVWCILLNDIVPFRMQWPQYNDLKVNGVPVKTVNRSGSQLLGANGRDDGAIVSLYVGEGFNEISLHGSDARSFCLGVRLVKRRTVQQVLNLIPREQEGENLANALERVCRCISGGMATAQEDSDSDLEVIADFVTVNLRCPMSGSRMKIASRFKSCAHMGCFDLETYVEINQRSRKWQCPICLKNYSLEDLIIDPYFSRITKLIEDSGSDVTEIDVKSNGSWRAKKGYAFMDLEQWHLPDGSICVSEIEATTDMEGIEGHSNTILDKTDNSIGSATPQNMQTLGSGNQVGDYLENYGQNVITMSSSSSESGRDNRTRSIISHGNEINSTPYNFGSTSGIANRSCSASFGDPNIIVLSDSEEENASMVFQELFP